MRKIAISIIGLLPVLLIVLIILAIAGVKNTNKGGEEMIKNVYVYLVLFATLMMVIGGSVAAFMAVADIIAPSPYHQTFEEFQRWGTGIEKAPGELEETKLSEKELQEKYDAMVKAYKENAIEHAKNNLVKSLGWIIIPFPIFLYFQRRIGRKVE